MHEDAPGYLRRKGAGGFRQASGAAGSRQEKRQSDHGGCVREACHCDGYPLHPPGEPHGAGGWHQGAGQGGKGALEDHSAC